MGTVKSVLRDHLSSKGIHSRQNVLNKFSVIARLQRPPAILKGQEGGGGGCLSVDFQ